VQQVGDAVGEHSRFTASGTGEDQNRAVGMRHSIALDVTKSV